MSGAAPLVLVVDDDDDATALLGMALGRGGYRVLAAGSCAEARRRLASYAFDAMILDVGLPDGSAYELVATLAARPRAVIVVSGLDTGEHQRRSKEAGIDAHFVKPVNLGKLMAKLDALLGRPGP